MAEHHNIAATGHEDASGHRSHGYSHRAIWRIAAPMILSGITVPMLGLVDTAVMGHLDGAHFLAAVAAAAIIFTVLFMGLNFLRMGTTGLTAQAFGAGDAARIHASLLQPLLLAMLLASMLLVGQQAVFAAALKILAPTSLTADYARAYFSIRIWSAPAALANLAIIGWLLGMQDARGPLLMTVVINLCNIVLDLLFVVGLGLEVRGVAAATLIGEYAGLAVGLGCVHRHLPASRWLQPPIGLLDRAGLQRLFQVNSNLFLRSMALMFVFAFITVQGARLGDRILASNALLLNFLYLLSYALDGIAHAAEALTGKAVGSANALGLRLTVRRTLAWTALLATGFAALYGLAGGLIIDLLTDLPELRVTARIYLPWLVVLPLAAAWCFLYDGVYIGLTRSREMRTVMIGSLLGLFLPVWYLLQDAGNHALWIALLVFMAGRSLGMHLWLRRILRQELAHIGHNAVPASH